MEAHITGIILSMRPANEKRRYDATSSLIGWVHMQNDPCTYYNGIIHAIMDDNVLN